MLIDNVFDKMLLSYHNEEKYSVVREERSDLFWDRVVFICSEPLLCDQTGSTS